MKIESIKDLDAVISLCRKRGVLSIEIDGVKLSLGDAPEKKLKSEPTPEIKSEDQYTPEQILMWSSAGIDG